MAPKKNKERLDYGTGEGKGDWNDQIQQAIDLVWEHEERIKKLEERIIEMEEEVWPELGVDRRQDSNDDSAEP